MNQRLIAALVAAPLVVVLVLVAALVPLPFATYEPGDTFDVLAEDGGSEIIQVDGAKVYRDDGQLRMTTVAVTTQVTLFGAMAMWASGEEQVLPRESVYPPGRSSEQVDQENTRQFVQSETDAEAAPAETQPPAEDPAPAPAPVRGRVLQPTHRLPAPVRAARVSRFCSA